MFYSDGFLHAIVDEEGLGPYHGKETGSSAGRENDTKSNHGGVPSPSAKPKADVSPPDATIDAADLLGNGNLSRRQQQKAKRKLKKQQAKEMKLQKDSEDNLARDQATQTCNNTNEAAPLRLHQYVSTVFRSELNVAENGSGYFIKNAPKVSAHHAILQGVVQLNGEVCKLGRTVLRYGDVVSLHLEMEIPRKEGDLIAWRGSEDVAKQLEGFRDGGERLGRMGSLGDTNMQKETLSDCDMIKYYREKLEKVWIPEVHESAIARPLPLTVRVLKPSSTLTKELTAMGFSPVAEVDFSLQLSCLHHDDKPKELGASTMQELLHNTWVARDDESFKSFDQASEKRLGTFLSEARVSGEIMQQELTSMLPVSIVAAHLKRRSFHTKADLRLLDLCSAPGSKTCQLLTALDGALSEEVEAEVDFTLVANEISSQRAHWMRQRLHQQINSKSLSNLIITCSDGRDYAKMDQNCFDYVVCDVPCSGDGTVRKSPKILSKWSPKNAAKNKPLQKELLKVGLGLLKPSDTDGFLVYSTCSLNPLENEEVMSEVLDEMNGNKEGKYLFELVDLSAESCSTITREKAGIDGCYLRVLPDKLHGGFFVAAIRKLSVSGGDNQQVVVREPCKTEEDLRTNHDKHQLVQRHIQNGEKATISYSISLLTQHCCSDIIEKLGKYTVISSGVTVMYESDSHRWHILQQGCASLVSSKQRDLYRYIQLTASELVDCLGKYPYHYREVVLPIKRLNTESLDPGTPLIIEVRSTSSHNRQGFLLPARILDLLKEDDMVKSVKAKIFARPQIYTRALATQKCTPCK